LRVIAERLGSTKTRKGTRHWQGDGMGTKDINARVVVDPDRWAEELATNLDDVISEIVRQRANIVARRLAAGGVIDRMRNDGTLHDGEQSTLGRIVGDTNKREMLVREAVDPVISMVREAATNQSQRMADLIQQMDKDGASVDDIRKAILSESNARSAWHKRLAVQAANAALQGTTAGITQGLRGIVSVVWKSRHDERVRPTHRKADGQRKPPGHKFRVGKSYLRFPGDPEGPPEEVINCRCRLVVESVAP
jgi:hypothetical protein